MWCVCVCVCKSYFCKDKRQKNRHFIIKNFFGDVILKDCIFPFLFWFTLIRILSQECLCPWKVFLSRGTYLSLISDVRFVKRWILTKHRTRRRSISTFEAEKTRWMHQRNRKSLFVMKSVRLMRSCRIVHGLKMITANYF